MIEGKLFQQSLETTDLEEAEKKQTKIMRPFMAADRVDAHAIMEARLRDAITERDTAEEAAHPPLAVADAWNAYLAATNRPDSSEAMLYRNGSLWKRFIKWLSADHPNKALMRDIDNDTASGYAQRLTADGLTASTFNQSIGFLRLVWRCLAEQIRGNGNPWLIIAKKRPQRLAHRHKTVTAEQFDNILKAAGNADLHDLLFVLGWTGQRLVDGVMLRWDCIDFKRRVITLNPVKTARTGKAVFIPLLPALAELLQKRRDMVAGEFVFPDLVKDHARDRSSLVKRIQKAFKQSGLTTNEHRPGVKRAITSYGAHSLRHFFATQALSAGIPGEIVKRITGHSSDAMLEGYEHVDAAMIGGLAAKLSNGKPLTALPAAKEQMIEAGKVRALAKKLNAKTWGKVKKELLSIT